MQTEEELPITTLAINFMQMVKDSFAAVGREQLSQMVYSGSFTPCFINNDYIAAGFPHSSVGKESACNAGDLGSIPGSGRSPGEGNGNPLPYSCLENPMDREAWQATVYGITGVIHNLAAKQQ